MAEITEAPDSVTSYQLESVILESDRLETRLSIENITTDIDIYEHIDKPYLTGSLVFVDSQGVFVGMDFLGGEKITIVVKSTRSNEVKRIKKTFFVASVISAVKVNDDIETVSLQLIEDIGYISNLINISKGYHDTCTSIITSLSKEFLNKKVFSIGNEFNKKFKVIIPNLTPIEALSWIKNKAVDTEGFPFFLFSTLVEDSIKFASLGDLLDKNVMNPALPYSYWQTASTSNDRNVQRRTILSYDYADTESLYDLIDDGVVGSDYQYINTLLGTQNNFHFDVMDDAFKQLFIKKSKNARPKMLPHDARFNLNGTSFNKLKSRSISQIGGSGAFNTGFDRVPSYNEEFDQINYKKKVAARAFHKFLFKSPINIVVNGIDFIDGEANTTIGNKLRVEFMHSAAGEFGENIKDMKRSGDYLIYAARHMFKKERYDIALNCMKVGNNK